MPDIGSIVTAISGIKTATDIARQIRDADEAFETADLKLRIAELVSSLAEAKLALVGVRAPTTILKESALGHKQTLITTSIS